MVLSEKLWKFYEGRKVSREFRLLNFSLFLTLCLVEFCYKQIIRNTLAFFFQIIFSATGEIEKKANTMKIKNR